jgi:hypothetical protein
MQINTGTLALALELAEGRTPRLVEDLGGEPNDPFSECVLTMLVGESEPMMLVVLDLPSALEPESLQIGDENEQPREE